MEVSRVVAILLALMLITLILSCAMAEEATSKEANVIKQKDPVEEIRAALAGLKAGWEAENANAIIAAYSEQYSNAKGADISAVRSYYRSLASQGVLKNTTVSIENIEVDVDGNSASAGPVAYYSTTGKPSFRYRLMKEADGLWRIVGEEAIAILRKPKPIELRRDAEKVWIDGLQEMDWGGATFNRQDSQVACLVEVLRCAGQDVTYADVMGLSGAAFKLTISPNLFIGQIHSEFGLDWSEIMQRIWGIDYKGAISCNEEENPDWRKKVRKTTVDSINAGLPLIYMDGEHNLIVGYYGDNAKYMTKPYAGHKGPYYEESETPRGFLGNAWIVTTLRKTGEPADWMESAIKSLYKAVELARKGGVKKLGGGDGVFAAYETWIATLDKGRDGVDVAGNAFSYTQLLSSRRAAAEYLSKVAGKLGGQAASHLSSAAESYETVAQRLDSGRDCVAAWGMSWTPENREKQASLLRKSLADERLAIAEIEKALEVLE